MPAVRGQLAATEPTLVMAAARALALREDKSSGDALVQLLDSTNAPIRRAAAEALAVCGSRPLAPRLVIALANARDDFEEHACVAALLALVDEPFARGLLKHDSPRVRRAALNLLEQAPFATLRFNDLVAPLSDAEAALRATAGRLLERHRSWATEALPWLRVQLAGPPEGEGKASALGRLMIAFQSDPGVRGLISELLDPAAPTPEVMRAFLLNLLPSFTAKPFETVWWEAIPPALANAALRVAALRAATAYPQPGFEPLLMRLAEDATIPAPQRLLAARASARHPALSEGVFKLALGSLEARAGAAERLGSVDLLARALLSAGQLLQLLEVLPRDGAVSPDALLPAFIRAVDHETRPVLGEFFAARLQSGWSPARATLDKALSVFPDDSPVRGSLLAVWEKNQAATLRRWSDFRALLTGGDVDRGREWFGTATCSGCHRIGERGGVIGPDLTKIGAIRSGGDLLESILYPSSSFAQGYEPYSLTRRDGEELSGSLVAQGPDGVSLRDATGAIHQVRSDAIASLARQQLSAMPEGLEQLLAREQFRDLLAYLQSLK